MWKNIGIGVLAVIIFVLCVMLGDGLSHTKYPPPPGMDPNDMDAIRAHMGAVPVGAFLLMMAGQVLGALLGGWLTGRFTGNGMVLVVVVGVMMLAVLANLFMLPHPAWYWANALTVPLAALLGFRTGRR